MKKIICLTIAFFSLTLNTYAASSANKIILTTQNWPPYQTKENDIVDGFAVQVVRCVLKKMGQPYEIKVVSWKRAQRMVKKGKAHGFFSASHNEIRDQYATISETIAAQKWNWYLLKENPMAPSDWSFKSKARVTAMFGSNMLTWLNKNGYNVFGHTQNTEVLIKLLIGKRIDAILANELVAKAVMEKTKTPPEIFKVYLNKDKPLGVYWSKKFLSENPGFLERFNRLIIGCR